MYTNEILRPIIYKKMHGNSAGNGKQRGEKKTQPQTNRTIIDLKSH